MLRRGGFLAAGGFAVALAAGLGCAQRDGAETTARVTSDVDTPGSMVGDRSALRAEAHDGVAIIRALGCGGCHNGVPEPARAIAGPLTERDPAREVAATFVYLRDTPRAAAPGAAHTPLLHLDDAEALALALYVAGGPTAGGAARGRFDAARQMHGDIEAADGARIFRALNCAVCHEHDGVEPRKNGPPLAGVASRLRPAALRDFLRRPRAVRPFGFEPGGGGRMPDFVLSDTEVDSIAAYLGTLEVSFAPHAPPMTGALSAFGAAKARTLLEQKLSCLGCHALDGVGGRVGPDLARAGERLTPEYLAAIVSDPEHAMPGTIMPAAAMPRATRELIIAFLAARGATRPAGGDATADAKDERGASNETGQTRGFSERAAEVDRAGYLSLIDHPITYPPVLSVMERGPPSHAITDPTARMYATQCAVCHGAHGRGDGYNARYLRVQPAVHASADSMSRRPDDTLFDGIHAGGAILGGSPEMPAFGGSLSAARIADLVGYIRSLCNCRQPSWAGDGR